MAEQVVDLQAAVAGANDSSYLLELFVVIAVVPAINIELLNVTYLVNHF